MSNPVGFCRIGIFYPANNKPNRGICCTFGATPLDVGRRLLDWYSDQAKVEQLIALGDIRSLGTDLTPDTIRGAARDRSATVAYMRDVGWYPEDCGSRAIHGLTKRTRRPGGRTFRYRGDHRWFEYDYLFDATRDTYGLTWYGGPRGDLLRPLLPLVLAAEAG